MLFDFSTAKLAMGACLYPCSSSRLSEEELDAIAKDAPGFSRWHLKNWHLKFLVNYCSLDVGVDILIIVITLRFK